jgi:membrane-anchored protein YejM (alkaline phosphatase superfamily)
MLADTSTNITALLGGSALIIGIITLVSILFSIWVWWKILAKAGYSGGLAILCVLLPFVGFIFLLILAFGEWPIYRELNMLRSQATMRAGQYPPQGPFPSGPQYPQGPFPSNPQYPQYRQ